MADLSGYPWVPKRPIEQCFFDADSTLSNIEGIDVLAQWNRVGDEVAAITNQCMSKTGMTPDAYQNRLDMVKPSLDQIERLSQLYILKLTEGVIEVMAILHQLGKQLFIVSAGIKQALLPLADYLHIPENHIFAVTVRFDDDGNYLDFEKSSPLTQPDGKSDVIQRCCLPTKSAMLIGDGLSDLEAQGVVDRFIGFGGHCIRQAIQSASKYYILSPNFLALLPLTLTSFEVNELTSKQLSLYKKGLSAIDNKQVHIKDCGNV